MPSMRTSMMPPVAIQPTPTPTPAALPAAQSAHPPSRDLHQSTPRCRRARDGYDSDGTAATGEGTRNGDHDDDEAPTEEGLHRLKVEYNAYKRAYQHRLQGANNQED